MPKTLEGACPGCGQALYIEIAVLAAPRGFADNHPVRLRETLNADGNGSTPSPDIRSGGQRPVCPTCGLDCRLVEAVAKKGENKGRSFRGWKCVNRDCDQNDKFAEFHWLTEAAAA